MGDALTSTTLFGSTRPTKDTISKMHWNLLYMVFMQIIRSVCPGYVPGLSTLMMRICYPNCFSSQLDFCHLHKITSKSSTLPFSHSTQRSFALNYSFLLLKLFFEYHPHGTFLYRTQLCSTSGLRFLRSPCISFCAKSVSIVFFTNCRYKIVSKMVTEDISSLIMY